MQFVLHVCVYVYFYTVVEPGFQIRGARSKESKINSKKILIDIYKKINKQLYANVIVIYNLNLVCKKNLGLRLKNAGEERKNCYT